MAPSNASDHSIQLVDSAPPSWMTRDYIEKVMKECEKDPLLKLLDYSIIPATITGDNLASIVLRLKVRFTSNSQEKSKNFIVKTEHFVEGFQMEAFVNRPLFETETSLYTKTIPEMHLHLKRIGVDEMIAPLAAYHTLEPNKVLFIDDLSSEYTMKRTPLNFEDSMDVMGKIAKFHALSYYLGESHAPMEQYTEGLISEKASLMMGFAMESFVTFTESVAKWGPEMSVIVEKLQTLQPSYYEKLTKLFAKNETFNVLNHGDFHVKNILFRNDKEAVDKIRLIDFQVSIWASPAIDLIFVLYGMANTEARKRREDLILHYYEEFVGLLRKLGFVKGLPSYLDLQLELTRNGMLEIFVISFFMPLLYMDYGVPELSIEKMVAMRGEVYNSAEYKEAIKDLLPVFLTKGFLDA